VQTETYRPGKTSDFIPYRIFDPALIRVLAMEGSLANPNYSPSLIIQMDLNLSILAVVGDQLGRREAAPGKVDGD
jgi:hypothetical protein